MKKSLLFAISLIFSQLAMAQYAPAGDSLKTRWAAEVTPENVWQEYPRPQMERVDWLNLNGLWDYAIRPKGQLVDKYDGKIFVPFCVESSLSGVQKYVGKDNELWYQRDFEVPSKWNGKRIMLNFGAVDWKCDVWVNDIKVGSHTGGYTPFTFDITQAVKKKGNVLKVRVWDPTDEGEQPSGKQHVKPHGIWYTPVTGIWQTVWLEPVYENYIVDMKIIPDVDNHKVTVIPTIVSNFSKKVKVTVSESGEAYADGHNPCAGATAISINGEAVEVPMPADAKLWSPDDPYLYNIEVVLYQADKVVDRVVSYFAMRKFSTAKDENGIVRLQLNNKPIFMFGPLDQGWWCDGLYTAPCDEALAYDVQKTKDLVTI